METSDDENEMPSEYFPPLKLYHEIQAKAQRREYYSKKAGVTVTSSMQNWRVYRNLRFFKSLMGFHKGRAVSSVLGVLKPSPGNARFVRQASRGQQKHRFDLTPIYPFSQRYTILKTAWEEYLRDFEELRQTATPTSVDVDYGGIIIKDVQYAFAKPSLWDSFQNKWHIHPTMGVSVFQWTDDVLSAMKEDPEPKIQSLCLQHLPVELIQQVYEMCTQKEARLLSSTSRYMRSLALPYIFGERTVQLDPGPWYKSIATAGASTKEDVFLCLQGIAVTGRDKYIETLEFILSRPDLTQSLTSLSLLNLWSPANQFEGTVAEGFLPTELDKNFYVTIEQYSHRVFRAAINLTKLRIMGFEITAEFVRITTQLPSLHTLSFSVSPLTNEVQTLALQADFPKYKRVLNLDMNFRSRTQDDDYLDPWFLLPLCPNVRTLTVQGTTSTSGIVLPPEDIWDALNPFKSLEKFAIMGLVGWEVAALGRWIKQASGREGRSIRMTHFKLETKGSFGEMDISVLVNSLGYAPALEVCVFEGICAEAATTGVISLIARHIPNILGLTVIVNDKWHSHRSTLRAWPSPMWAYGSRFSSFSRLQYFGWNNRFGPEIAPAQMLFMEEGYPDESDEWMLLSKVDNESYLWDFERTGAVFGAYCPSLKFVGLSQAQIVMVACSIDRSDGKLVVESHEFGSSRLREITQWDTSILQGW